MKCGNCKQDHPTVADVKSCYAVMRAQVNLGTNQPPKHPDAAQLLPQPSYQQSLEGIPERTPVPQSLRADSRVATDKQVNYLALLVAEREWPVAGTNELEARNINTCECVMEGKRVTFDEASAAIAYLKPRAKRVIATVKQQGEELEDGWYLRDGIVWMVYHTIHGRNEQVTKELIITDTGEVNEDGDTIYSGEWAYRGKAGLVGLKADMVLTEEEARKMGCLYGVCVSCARSLTRDESKHVGYGKKCASNHGWWYPTRAELKALQEKAAK